ncbi:hypothetical protein ACP4OV_015928 [Aristida adscensionis]
MAEANNNTERLEMVLKDLDDTSLAVPELEMKGLLGNYSAGRREKVDDDDISPEVAAELHVVVQTLMKVVADRNEVLASAATAAPPPPPPPPASAAGAPAAGDGVDAAKGQDGGEPE